MSAKEGAEMVVVPTTEELCTFCWAIREESRNLYRTVVSERVQGTYLLHTTRNFVVIPEIGSFEPGYLIVAPKAHVLSFGHMPAGQETELDAVVRLVQSWVQKYFRPRCVMFEHGPISESNRGGACTDHAHLHVAPVPSHIDLRPVLGAGRVAREVRSWSEAARLQVSGNMPYLYLRHVDGTMWMCDAPVARSQEFRRELVRQLGLEEIWDWSAFPGSAHVLATIRQSELHPLTSV